MGSAAKQSAFPENSRGTGAEDGLLAGVGAGCFRLDDGLRNQENRCWRFGVAIRMSSEGKPELHLEIAHVLFMDVVGFSKLLINDQSELLEQLNQVVRDTSHFREAEASGKLIRLPTGDGMALVFLK